MPAFLLRRTEPDANAPTEQGRKSPLPGGWKFVRLCKTGYIVATSFGYDCVFLPLSNRKLLMLLAIRAAIEPPTHGLLIRWQTLILISPYY